MTQQTKKRWYDDMRWTTPGGELVSCVEKLKVLQENLHEIEALAQDAFEDAVLMGCDEKQVREALTRLIVELKNPYKGK